MSQNRREEENGQKETERRRMVEVTRLNRKENQTGASCESNLSFLLLKHGQRRAAGKWRRESRPNPPPDERGGRIRTSTRTAPALMNPSLEQDLDFKSLGLEKGRASKGKRKHPSLFLKKRLLVNHGLSLQHFVAPPFGRRLQKATPRRSRLNGQQKRAPRTTGRRRGRNFQEEKKGASHRQERSKHDRSDPPAARYARETQEKKKEEENALLNDGEDSR